MKKDLSLINPEKPWGHVANNADAANVVLSIL